MVGHNNHIFESLCSVLFGHFVFIVILTVISRLSLWKWLSSSLCQTLCLFILGLCHQDVWYFLAFSGLWIFVHIRIFNYTWLHTVNIRFGLCVLVWIFHNHLRPTECVPFIFLLFRVRSDIVQKWIWNVRWSMNEMNGLELWWRNCLQ